MNKQKLISVLQSRIAESRTFLASSWELYEELKTKNVNDSKVWKAHTVAVGITQKENKQILKQLIMDERIIKMFERVLRKGEG